MNPIILKSPITIRPATLADVPFIDTLQKQHAHQVGWMPTKQLEGKINAGQVIVAWASRPCSSVVDQERQNMGETPMPREEAVGYCIGHDQYFKRDDVGIIYQMNVATGRQRELVGASLLKAQFARSAWGCKLYCCWCAQDIAANRFWESMGFVPLAFRAGSEKKSRVHIFWQRRIRAGDVTTPYWFPAQTTGGSIREDRLVLPIPPNTHWSDAKPLVLPKEQAAIEERKRLPGEGRSAKPVQPRSKAVATASGGVWFRPKKPARAAKTEKVKEPKRKRKNDPKLVAAARELRDRWLEQVNSLQLVGEGKYEVSRAIAGSRGAVKRLAA